MSNWTTRRLEDGDLEYHDGTRVRAVLQYRKGGGFPWVVHRISSMGRNMGCDSFRTKSEAHCFITDGKVFI